MTSDQRKSHQPEGSKRPASRSEVDRVRKRETPGEPDSFAASLEVRNPSRAN